MADLLEISLPELLGIVPELPPCTSEWHKYPTDQPHEGETVLCRYGKRNEFDVLIYHDGGFCQMFHDEFVSVPFAVQYWTRAFPDT